VRPGSYRNEFLNLNLLQDALDLRAPLLQFVFVVAVIGAGNLVNQARVAFLQNFQQQLLFGVGQPEFHSVSPVNDGNNARRDATGDQSIRAVFRLKSMPNRRCELHAGREFSRSFPDSRLVGTATRRAGEPNKLNSRTKIATTASPA